MIHPGTTKPTTARPFAKIARLARELTPAVLIKACGFLIIAIVAVVASVESAPGTAGLLGACLAVLMLSIAIIDWHAFIIPNPLNAAGFCLGLLHAIVQQPEQMALAAATAVTRGVLLALLLLGLRFFYARVRGRQGLGLGDVKLAGVAGAWLDWSIMPLSIEVAAFAALAFYALRQFVLRRRMSATSRLPFGLFFAPAIWICWLLETAFLAPF